jgi:hypothetical protein
MPVGLSQRNELHVPDHANLIAHAYSVDPATLRFIASSRELSVQMPQEPLETPFSIWEDGRSALAEFLDRTSIR